MSSLSIFEYQDYRAYVEDLLASEDYGRGAKGQLAAHLNCQPSFVSQVLKGKNTLSLEQGFKINSFFKHSRLERDYFMHLIEIDKAGTKELKDYFFKKLEEVKDKSKLIENHIEYDQLSETDTIAYYNNWNNIYARLLIQIPEYQTHTSLLKKMNIEKKELNHTLDFLISRKLVITDEEQNFKVGTARLHIKKNSPLSDFANSTTRLQNIHNLKRKQKNDISYCAYMTISEKNLATFKQRFVNLLSDLHESLENDKEEKVCSLTLDFMEL